MIILGFLAILGWIGVSLAVESVICDMFPDSFVIPFIAGIFTCFLPLIIALQFGWIS